MRVRWIVRVAFVGDHESRYWIWARRARGDDNPWYADTNPNTAMVFPTRLEAEAAAAEYLRYWGTSIGRCNTRVGARRVP